MVDEEVMEVEDMRRKRREADPVVIPAHANVLPTTYHHLAGAYPVYQTSVYNPYLSYPLHQVQHQKSFSCKKIALLCLQRDTHFLHAVIGLAQILFELAYIHC